MRKVLFLLLLLGSLLYPQTITVEETLKDNENNNVVGFIHISNPSFLYPYGSALAVTDCTNATPIVVTTATHGYATNDTVYIVNVTGNTACNGTFRITVLTTTTFELNGSVGNGAFGAGGTSQKLIPVAARTRRYPTSGTFSGTVTINLIPTSTAIAIPSGSAAGFTYLASYTLSDGSTYSEQWNPAPTPSKQTISGIKVPGVVNPTAAVALTQLASQGAANTDVLTFNGTSWVPYTVPPRALYIATASQNRNNTAAENSIVGTGVGSLTLPANYYSGAGKALYVTASGYYGNTGTPTLNIKLKHGSTVLAQTGAITTSTGATNWAWHFRGVVTCRSTGASGTVDIQGEFIIQTLASGTSSAAIYSMVNTSAVTIDTTVTQAVDLTETWGTANSLNTITGASFAMYNIAIP